MWSVGYSLFDFRLDFLKVVRMVSWSGVVGPELSLARSRFALGARTIALRAQKRDLWASLTSA